jgi:predicted HTH transcriptional regulator
LRLLTPRLFFHFYEVDYNGKWVVVLEIPRATGKPTQFSGSEFVRIGSYTKKLKDFPDRERELWKVFETVPFEDLKALENVDSAIRACGNALELKSTTAPSHPESSATPSKISKSNPTILSRGRNTPDTCRFGRKPRGLSYLMGNPGIRDCEPFNYP